MHAADDEVARELFPGSRVGTSTDKQRAIYDWSSLTIRTLARLIRRKAAFTLWATQPDQSNNRARDACSPE
jgi:hypothetical protein